MDLSNNCPFLSPPLRCTCSCWLYQLRCFGIQSAEYSRESSLNKGFLLFCFVFLFILLFSHNRKAWSWAGLVFVQQLNNVLRDPASFHLSVLCFSTPWLLSSSQLPHDGKRPALPQPTAPKVQKKLLLFSWRRKTLLIHFPLYIRQEISHISLHVSLEVWLRDIPSCKEC